MQGGNIIHQNTPVQLLLLCPQCHIGAVFSCRAVYSAISRGTKQNVAATVFDVYLIQKNFTSRVGGVKLDAGRQNFKTHTGNILDTEFDGAKLAYGDKVKLTGYVGSAAKVNYPTASALAEDDRLYIADLSAKLGVVDAYVSYYNVDNGWSQEIWNVGAALPIVKDLTLKAEYMNGSADEDEGLDNNGWVAGLAYKGAKASKPGSWGVYANYYDMAALTYLNNTNDSYNGVMNKWQNDDNDGFEGFEVGANVALAKNIVAGVKYFDLESREGDVDEQAIWSEVVFTF